MNKALVAALVAIALATGIVGGLALARQQPSQASATNLTPYERGQLMVGCYGIAEQNTEKVGNFTLNQNASGPPHVGALPGSRDACLAALKALP